MAPSLQALVDFLLAEIALCGNQGASLSNVLTFISTFYSKSQQDAHTEGSPPPVPTQNVDRRFQEKVWSWLTRHPEVSVGKDKEGNHLSLADAVEINESKTQTANSRHKTTVEDSSCTPIRVYVSEERTWLAIAGHEPDEAKLLPLEFVLLSIIASRRSRGILQTELTKLSGQDKRSVPKRTDLLQQKGYIEKRIVHVSAVRTSLCTLRRFVSQKQIFNEAEVPANQEFAAKPYDRIMIDIQAFLDKFFDILREHSIIARDDLKRLLGFDDRWRWKLLSRSTRKFERLGVVKRVMAKSQYSHSQLHPCIMFIREPSKRDLDMFFEFDINSLVNYEQGVDNANEEQDDDLAMEGATKDISSTNLAESVDAVKRDAVEGSGRILPIWTPDRLIQNLLFDVIDSTGTSGKTNWEIMHTCFGRFFRRPLESFLARAVECWQLSQPPHLRHLAIVRDVAVRRTTTYYVQYSAQNFARLVDSGLTQWEAVEFAPRDAKSAKLSVPPVIATPKLDEYGLPYPVSAKSLPRGGEASLFECMQASGPSHVPITSSDLTATRYEDGSYGLIFPLHSLANDEAPQRLTEVRTTVRSKGAYTQQKRNSSLDDVSKMEVDDTVDGPANEPASEPINEPKVKTTRPARIRTEDDERLAGMSEKEKLETLGLDESWTEYKILLIERPHPGVYMTPLGRRRPTGKSRGRPRISRLAVFKSPRLTSLPWFVGEASEAASKAAEARTDIENSAPVEVASSQWQPVNKTPVVTPASPRGQKRSLTNDEPVEIGSASKIARVSREASRQHSIERRKTPDEEDIPVATTKTPEKHATARTEEESGTASSFKRRRTSQLNCSKQVAANSEKDARGLHDNQTRLASQENPTEPYASYSDDIQRPSRKRRREASHSPNRAKAPAAPAPAVVEPEIRETSHAEDGPPNQQQDELNERFEEGDAAVPIARNEKNQPPGKTQTKDTATAEAKTKPTEEPRDVGSNHEKPKTKTQPKKGRHAGSVAFLRRNIIMGIVEKAGGAFPMGTELWYPFATMWTKANRKETPDWRTIKAVAKQMIDAGKVKQLTFSGKDSKGVMTTKSIIAKPDMSSDDPLIKNMQREMLATGPQYYFPANTEIDAELRSGRKRTAFRPSLPVETDVTVQLQQKPGYVRANENRRTRPSSVKLLKNIERNIGIDFDSNRQLGTTRLMDIRKASRAAKKSQPGEEAPAGTVRISEKPSGSISRMKRFLGPESAYTMLINPKQTFHASTGTFATDAGLAAFRKPSTRRDQEVGDSSILPESLDDLLSKARKEEANFSTKHDPRSSKFFSDNDAIARWELQSEEIHRESGTDRLRYINQTIDDDSTVPISGRVRFDVDKPTKRRGRPPVEETRPTPARNMPLSSSSPPPAPLQQRGPESSVYSALGAGERVVRRRRRRRAADAPPNDRRLAKLTDHMAASEEGKPPGRTPTAKVPSRRIQVPHVPDPLYKRIMTAIVVVRCLTGGAEARLVDWGIVTSIFPDHDAGIMQERGRQILAGNRLQIHKMQNDFHERFIEAYARDEVPRIDYDDLEGYDWEKVVDWAYTQLDVPVSSKLPDLPATRGQFDEVFELREDPSAASLDEIYNNNAGISSYRRRNLLAGAPFAIPLREQPSRKTAGVPAQHQKHPYLARLDVAKTWVRANITAPEELYNPAEARRALDGFGERLVSDAVQSLVTERAIMMNKRGRVMPGRNYDITEYFLFTISRRRLIESTQLRRAAKFKTTILDPALRRPNGSARSTTTGTYDVQYGAEDGDILVLINLAAEGKVILRPRDPPRDKFGLTDGGYLTRNLDRNKVRFNIEVRPVAGAYEFGNPVWEKASRVPPPSPFHFHNDDNNNHDVMEVDHDHDHQPHQQQQQGGGQQQQQHIPPPPPSRPSAALLGEERIPVWFDIHGNFIKLLWDLVVGAVVGCVAIRPGVSAAGVASMLKPCMGAWEVYLLLDWLRTVGVAGLMDGYDGGDGCSDEDRPGWVVREGWWLILG